MKEGIADRLTITYVRNCNTGETCLTVGRRRGRGYKIINTLFNNKADALYEQIIGRKLEEE